MGKKTTQEQKEKTQHKTDDGFCFFDFSFLFFLFFFFFFANGKKMGCPQHRGFLSLCISHCPQPLGCQMLPDTVLHVPDAEASPPPT